MATMSTPRTIRTKEFAFPVSVRWTGERSVAASVPGKTAIEVAPPPVFGGVDDAAWSPEDFLVAAAASCLAITFTGLAKRAGLAYRRLDVNGEGTAGQRTDGRFGFTRIRLDLEIETDAADEARRLALEAERRCLVASSLDLPVDTHIEILAPAA